MLNIYNYRLLYASLFLNAIIFAQQGQYVRKSVSSLESVWIKPGAVQNVSKVDLKIFNNFMKFYIEVQRFDFNTLPKNQVEAFVRQANSLKEVNVKSLSEVMENTIVKDILKILNDPDIKKKRGRNLKSDSDFQSFAATKAKSLGLTTEQLGTLLNSAYIYLPYVTKFTSEKDGSDLSLSIEGGIIWWQVKVSPNGYATLEKVLDASSTGENTIDLEAKNLITKKKREYDEYSFGDKKFKTTPETYLQGGAMLAFAKNLGVKTKELDDFKLQAQVLEKVRNKYNFKLGLAEGVHLDDGFFLVEITEDKNGNEMANEIGFLRIAKTGKNEKDPLALSSAVQLYGDQGEEGSLVMEHPRLGMDTRVRLGYKSGLNIPAEHTAIPGFFQILDSDASSAAMVDLDFSYNLAPIINISQSFLDLGLSVGVPLAKLTDEAITNKVASLVWDVGAGFSKKIWMGRMNIPLGLMFNFQSFSMGSEKLQYNISSLGFSLTGGIEYMLNADLTVHTGVEMNIAMPPGRISLTYNEEEIYSYTDPKEISELYPELFLGGWNFKIGVDYSLGELPFDLFGFLDPMKKY